jgi:hypothetical protein
MTLRKICIGLTAAILLSLSLSGCQSPAERIANDINEQIASVHDSMQAPANSRADIQASGSLSGMTVDKDAFSLTFQSWDLGYTGNYLSPGEEVLCVKGTFANLSDDDLELYTVAGVVIFIDGAEQDIFFSDFYGEGTARNFTSNDRLKPNATADIYFCVPCSVNDPHEVIIEVNDSVWKSGVIYGEFTFSTD